MSKHLRQGRAWHESDRARVHATPQVFHAGEAAAPAPIIHGDADPTAPVEHGRRMAKALARAGRPHEYLELAGAGHGLGNASHRLRFLATHPGPEAQH